MIAGTPMYMSPEQAQGESIDHRADLFSLGSVLYVMCSGRPPFRASTTLAVLKRVAEDEPRPIREIIPEVPEWLCAIIARLHAKDPAERYQTATEVAGVLEGYLRQLTAGEVGPHRWQPRSGGAEGRCRPGGVGAALAATLAVVAALAAAAAVGATWRCDGAIEATRRPTPVRRRSSP